MEEHSRKPSLLAKDGKWALTTSRSQPGGVCLAKAGFRGGGRGADTYPGSNSQGPQGPPTASLSPLPPWTLRHSAASLLPFG